MEFSTQTFDLFQYKHPTPPIRWQHPLFEQYALKVFIKQDYLNHPLIQGNKLWKLRNAILTYSQGKYKKIISFGGAYSNHLAALGGVAQLLQIPMSLIIRGEQPDTPGFTLRQLAQNPMVSLHFVDRTTYRRVTGDNAFHLLNIDLTDALILPEGGSTSEGIDGFKYFWREIKNDFAGSFPNEIWIPAGTGGTAAGLISAIDTPTALKIVHILKHDALQSDIKQFLNKNTEEYVAQSEFINTYHFGGYAKFDQKLIDFILSIYRDYQVPLDPIYNAKSFYGFFDRLTKGQIATNQTVLLLHTGGLQGIEGFKEQHGLLQEIDLNN